MALEQNFKTVTFSDKIIKHSVANEDSGTIRIESIYTIENENGPVTKPSSTSLFESDIQEKFKRGRGREFLTYFTNKSLGNLNNKAGLINNIRIDYRLIYTNHFKNVNQSLENNIYSI